MSRFLLQLLLLSSTIPGAAASAAQEPVEAAPPHTRVVLENDHVRVTELFAPAGAQAPMHEQQPAVLVSLESARLEMRAPDGTLSLLDYHPGQIVWAGEPARRAWKVLAGEAHLFFVEIKSAAGKVPQAQAPLDPGHSTIIDPEQHHLVLDNEHVRIIDGLAGAGARSAAHTHPPSVLVSLAKSRFKVTIEGRTRIFDFEPATVRWTNHFEHTWQILSGEARVIMVEVKSAHGAPAFQRRSAARER